MKARENERGAVLLTTLLLMTVMAAITIAIIDDIRFSITRAANVQMAEQLTWYERGGEDYARSWLTTKLTQKQTGLAQIILQQSGINFPIDGGEILINVRDGQNCFNINQLTIEKTAPQTRKQFSELLKALEFDNLEADTLSASIQDWVDADGIPGQGGAEDFAYMNLVPAHHAANMPMVDITELRAIQGVNEETYQRLKPYVCASKNAEVSKLNLNTLSFDQAPLLGMIFGGEDGLEAAEAVIAQRPQAGYESVDKVWELEIVKDLELKGAGKDMVSVSTNIVALDIRVRFGEQVRGHTAVFELGGVDGVKLISRRSVY